MNYLARLSEQSADGMTTGAAGGLAAAAQWRREKPSIGSGFAAAALHLAVLLGLLRAIQPAPTGAVSSANASAVLWFRLRPVFEPPAPPKPLSEATRIRATPSRQTAQPVPTVVEHAPGAGPVAPLAGTGPPITDPALSIRALPASAPLAPAPPASAPLDLRLRPGAAQLTGPAALVRSIGLSQPTGLSGLATDLRLTEQAMGQGRRFRQGDGCVEARPSRATQLDPFGKATPMQLNPC